MFFRLKRVKADQKAGREADNDWKWIAQKAELTSRRFVSSSNSRHIYLCKNKISLSDGPIDSSAPVGFDSRCLVVVRMLEKKKKEEKKNICYLRFECDWDAIKL